MNFGSSHCRVESAHDLPVYIYILNDSLIDWRDSSWPWLAVSVIPEELPALPLRIISSANHVGRNLSTITTREFGRLNDNEPNGELSVLVQISLCL